MKPFYVDTETFGSEDLNAVGLSRYLQGDELECLIATYARGDEPVERWDATDGSKMPAKLEDALCDERVMKAAHNAQFDRNIFKVVHGIDSPWESWLCTMAQAYSHGLPGSLEAAGVVLGLPADMQKLVDGKRLIQLFCVKRKGEPRTMPWDAPEDWQRFLAYAAQDTAALREIHKRMPSHNYKGEQHLLWAFDQEINERGFYVDQDLCRAAVAMKNDMADKLNAQVEALTDGRVTKPTQRERILTEIVGEHGIMMLDMKRDTLERMLEDPNLPEDTRTLLRLRINGSLTSLTKYNRALERVSDDGRMRHTLQFSGAGRTGRWAGRGVQPHNMPRPKRDPDEIEQKIIPAILDGTLPQKYDDVNGACQDALRSMIIAEPGCELHVGDWSNIEGRCVAWEAEEDWKLDAFRANDAGEGEDLYIILYARLFGLETRQVDGKMRQKGKAFELAFGYGGGVGACVTAAATYGIDLIELSRVASELAPADVYTKAERAWERAFIRGEDFQLDPWVYIGCDIAKQMYRRANQKIAQLWWDTERAVKWAIERPGSLQFAARCKMWYTGTYLVVELPSGRRLLYAQPKLSTVVEFDEDTEELNKRVRLSYMNANSKQWRRTYTYGGKLVENITQAIANDVLRKALLRARADGWPIILHVHDELVAETPIGLFALDDLLQLMERPLWWADDLPLKAAGYTAQRYKKD